MNKNERKKTKLNINFNRLCLLIGIKYVLAEIRSLSTCSKEIYFRNDGLIFNIKMYKLKFLNIKCLKKVIITILFLLFNTMENITRVSTLTENLYKIYAKDH